ncbi:unnamed protein product [Symbiodinium microadriaticum]|nr:unnamed protein product [Symbiodinium microadriaticum]
MPTKRKLEKRKKREKAGREKVKKLRAANIKKKAEENAERKKLKRLEKLQKELLKMDQPADTEKLLSLNDESLTMLEQNIEILKGLEAEYEKEQAAKEALNEGLEEQGHLTLDEKLKAVQSMNISQQKAQEYRRITTVTTSTTEERKMSEFGSINLDEMQKEHERVNSDGNQGSFLDQFVPMPDPPQGKKASITLRLLPPTKGGRLFQYTRYQKVNGRKVHCPRPLTSDNKWDKSVPNPLGDYYSALWRRADKVKAEEGESDAYKELVAEARSIKPVERYYYNAIIREITIDGTKQTNVGPRVLSVGKTLHGKILSALFGDEGDPSSKLGDVTNLKSGFDFVIRVKKDGDFPKYDDSSFARETSPAGTPEEIAEWAKNLHDLTKFRVILPLERLEKELAIHRGHLPDEVEGFDIDGFDAKYASNGSSDTPAETSDTSVSSETVTEASADDVPGVVEGADDLNVEDIEIENQDFLSELEEFKQG